MQESVDAWTPVTLVIVTGSCWAYCPPAGATVRAVPSRTEITRFYDPPTPAGQSPWVPGAGPEVGVRIVDPDPDWPRWYAEWEVKIRAALGWRVLSIDHIGSTSVPGLAAKPIIDVDLTVADPNDEPAYVPALQSAGFELRVREPWWYGHRVLRAVAP